MPAKARTAAMTASELRDLMKRAGGLTQVQLADKLGINRTTVSRWLNDQTPINAANAAFIRAALRKRDRA